MSRLNNTVLQYRLKNGTAANFTTDAKNQMILAEPAYTTDDKQLYISDGSGNAAPVGGGLVTLVGSLPSAGTVGRRAFVTNSVSTTFASTITGGGTATVPVYDDGTNWRIG